MRHRIVQLFAIAAIALPAAAHAQTVTRPDSVRLAMRAEERREGKREPHPEIRAAIRALERAKLDLQRASHDFGGHRADALRSVDESIRQLKLALQYDKK